MRNEDRREAGFNYIIEHLQSNFGPKTTLIIGRCIESACWVGVSSRGGNQPSRLRPIAGFTGARGCKRMPLKEFLAKLAEKFEVRQGLWCC